MPEHGGAPGRSVTGMRTRRKGPLLLLALLAACSGGSRTASPTQSAAPSPTPAPVRFRTADGTVGCELDTRHVVCDVGAHTWSAPPKPAGCSSTWGRSVQFTIFGHPSYVCGRTASALGASRVLTADESVRLGLVTCHAVAGGVRCFGEAHGFLLSRTVSQLF